MSKLPQFSITYDPINGDAIRDGFVILKLNEIINYAKRTGDPVIAKFATENMINAFRVAVRRGRINPDNIVFKFEGQELRVDLKGRFKGPYPDKGFLDFNVNLLLELL